MTIIRRCRAYLLEKNRNYENKIHNIKSYIYITKRYKDWPCGLKRKWGRVI